MSTRERRTRRLLPQDEYDETLAVCTIQEAAAGWHKHPKSIVLAIDTRRLAARRTGLVWLISYKSLVRLWGQPIDFAYDEPF